MKLEDYLCKPEDLAEVFIDYSIEEYAHVFKAKRKIFNNYLCPPRYFFKDGLPCYDEKFATKSLQDFVTWEEVAQAREYSLQVIEEQDKPVVLRIFNKIGQCIKSIFKVD